MLVIIIIFIILYTKNIHVCIVGIENDYNLYNIYIFVYRTIPKYIIIITNIIEVMIIKVKF